MSFNMNVEQKGHGFKVVKYISNPLTVVAVSQFLADAKDTTDHFDEIEEECDTTNETSRSADKVWPIG